MKTKKTFKLFANCLIVDGAAKATICDLHRGKVFSIPLSMAETIHHFDGKEFEKELSNFPTTNQSVILSYFDFLIKEELGFFTDERERYPDLDLTYRSFDIINNAILEIEGLNITQISNILDEFKLLRVKHVELRLYKSNNLKTINYFLNRSKHTYLRTISIYAYYNSEISIASISETLKSHPRVVLFLLHSVNSATLQKLATTNKNILSIEPRIQLIDKVIDSNKHCGIIDKRLFSIEIPVFTESINFNSCLNKKFSIDGNGNIKNCPSLPKIFGNIDSDKISDIVTSSEFQKKWGISKDSILVCKSCEYRRVCTDCRAYVEDPKDEFSKPLKCGYNPFSGEWTDWKSDKKKISALEFYEIDI